MRRPCRYESDQLWDKANYCILDRSEGRPSRIVENENVLTHWQKYVIPFSRIVVDEQKQVFTKYILET